MTAKIKRKPGRPRLLSLEQVEKLSQIVDNSYTDRNLRDKSYAIRAITALNHSMGAEGMDAIPKLIAKYPAVCIGTDFNHFKYKFSLLTELGRWEPEVIPLLAEFADGMKVKDAIHAIRVARLDPEKHTELLAMSKEDIQPRLG